MKNTFLAVGILLLYSCPCFGQKIMRNFSFEYLDCHNQMIGWSPQITQANAYRIMLSTKNAKDGSCSISISSNPDYQGEKAVGLFNTGIGDSSLKSKDSIRISAYIKTQNVTDGVASIWMQLNGLGRIVRDISFDKTGITGTADWQQVSISLPVTEDVISASFGCKLTGKGEAFFDAFSVTLDGQKIE